VTSVETEQLSCQELVELVTAYLDGALAPDEHARFEQHLALCRGCQAYFAQMQATIDFVGQLTPADLSPEAEAALLEAFRDWKR
jgi:anti-sigma factor RsiW